MSTKRSTSTTANVNNVANALNTIKPPPEAGELDESELKLFNVLVRGKATDDWFDHELIQVATLARLTAHLERARKELKREGDVIYNAKGTLVANPMFYVCDSLMRQQLALSRSIGLSSTTAQKKEHVIKRAKAENDTRDKVSKTGLLAVPNK